MQLVLGSAGQAKSDQSIGVEIVRDLVEQQRPVQIMDDHAVRGIAGEGGLHRFVEGGRIGGADRGRQGGVGMRCDFRKQRSVAGKEADVLRAGIDQRVEARGRERRRSRRRSRRACGRSAGLLIEAGVVAADRNGDQVILVERAADGREGSAAAGQEGIPLGDKAGQRGLLVLVLSVSAPPMAKLSTGTSSKRAQRIDIVGAAREAPRSKGWRERDPGDLEQVAVVGIAVAERNDLVDALRGGRGCGQCARGKQRQCDQAAILSWKILPEAASESRG